MLAHEGIPSVDDLVDDGQAVAALLHLPPGLGVNGSASDGLEGVDFDEVFFVFEEFDEFADGPFGGDEGLLARVGLHDAHEGAGSRGPDLPEVVGEELAELLDGLVLDRGDLGGVGEAEEAEGGGSVVLHEAVLVAKVLDADLDGVALEGGLQSVLVLWG